MQTLVRNSTVDQLDLGDNAIIVYSNPFLVKPPKELEKLYKLYPYANIHAKRIPDRKKPHRVSFYTAGYVGDIIICKPDEYTFIPGNYEKLPVICHVMNGGAARPHNPPAGLALRACVKR
jgi:hypothetical protein